MKLYIRSASTLKEMSQVIERRLQVDGVDKVNILDINSGFATVKLTYNDGSISSKFRVRFKNKPNREETLTSWNPNWSITDGGEVISENGIRVGWFKLLKRKPQSATANYLEDSLVVDYGTREINLTDDSGPRVAKAVKQSR